MRKLLLLIGCLWLISFYGFSQTITSNQVGNWNVNTTWVGGVIPTAANSTLIQINHDVTIPSGFTAVADQIAVAAGITFTVSAGGTLSLQSSGGTDLTLTEDFVSLFVGANFVVNGDFINNSLTAVDYGSGLSTTAFNSGGRYVHAINGLTLPFSGTTWDANSTCQITGITSSAPGNINQVFGNFTWNCPSQSGNLVLGLTSATINGNLSLLNTNSPGILTLANTAGTVVINGNFSVSGTSRFLGSTNANVSINVGGDFTFGSTAAASILITQTNTMNLNVKKNFSVTSGILQARVLTTATANVNFNGNTSQTYISGGTLTGPFNWTIKNGSIVDLGTSAFVNAGNFTLEAGGTMKVGSPDGLSTGTSLGNVRVSGVRTYTANGNIIYNGSVAQNLGDEWGATGALNAIAVNLEIANSSIGGVTNNVIGSTSLVGNLKLTTGSLNIGNSNTLQIQSNFTATGGTIGGDPTSILTFSGSGTITGNLNFTAGLQSLNNFTINRGGTLTLGTGLTVAGVLAFSSTGNLKFDGQTLTVNGDITQAGSGGLISTVSTNTNLLIGGTGALSSLPFSGAPQLNNVTFGRTSASTYTWNTAATVNGTLTLSSGILTHSSGLTMANGSTFSRSAGSSVATSAPGTSGSYNVIYIGDLTTGFELPSSVTALNNLTIGGNDALDKAITINGDLNINSGTLSAGAFNVTVAGANFLANGGAFTINAGSLVTFSRAGTTTMGGSSIGGTQFGNLTINSGATLSAPNANINISGTWNNLGTFTANTGSVTFNGASQNLNPNSQPFNDVVFAGTGTKTLQGTLTANGTLTINASSTLNVGSNQAINVAGSWVNNGTFTAGAGTVTFNGTAQSINANGQAFFNLTLANSGTKTLANPITIGGALTINSGVTLDVSPSAYAITLAGNWVNNGIFTRGSGTVTFNGTTVLSGSTAPSLNNVTIAGALTTTSGITDVSGNWLQSSGTFTHNGGTLQFSGNTQSITPGGQTFNSVTVSGTNTKTLLGSTIVAGILTLSSGTFDSNGNALDIKGNFVSNSTSVLTASTITFSGATALSGGTTPTFGAITITGSLTPSANFNVNGNLINNGTLTASAGTVTFGGTTTISGTSVSSFNNVTIGNTLTAPAGNLNVAGSWTNNGTFTASGGTIVFNGTTSFAGSSASNFANITISGIVNAPATLNVAGNFANNGTFNRGTGTVVFNGSSTQSISGSSVTDFNNITVSNNINSPAVQVQSNQNLRGVLTLSGTTTAFDADGSVGTSIFKLMSSAEKPTQDASIATLPVGTSVTGNVTMQRYMAIEGNGNRIYRYISSPVSGAPVSQIQAFIPVTGTFTGASSCSGCSTSQSMFSYDETVITGDLNSGYINFPAAANSETFVSGRGYTLYVRGDIAPVLSAGSALWELRGPINSGNTSLPVSFTSSGTLANDGWNLVGNPFPATIDWNAAGWTKTNINNATYMRDNSLGSPVYATYVSGVGANGGSQYIAAGQAFFVKSDGGVPVLTAPETIKVGGTQTTYFRQATIPDMIRVTLRQGTTADESVIRFTAEATSKFDAQWDAYKLKNPVAFNVSSFTSDNKKLAINAMPPMQSCLAVIKMDVSNVTAGSFTLDFSDFDSFINPGTKISLFDSYAKQTVDVRQINSYSFQVTTDTASYGSNRFSLTFGEGLATITAMGATSCSKGTVTVNATGAPDGNYRWYEDATGGSPIAGATASSFTTPIIDKSKTYYVAPANASGCAGQRIPVVVTVTTLDPVTISEVGSALKSNYVQGNQWYFNGKLIPGATNQTIEPQQSGAYLVQIKSSNCITFAEREFVITGLEEGLPSNITIYPNPTSGSISVAVKSTNEVNARLISLMGITIHDKLLEGTSVKRGSFNLEEQSEGMYILIVQDGSQVYKTRIIKKR